MPIKITAAQNRRLHQLLNETGLIEDKKDLVRSFTNGRAESSKELSVKEANRLILHLEGFHQTHDPADRMRKKIFAICHHLQWIYGSSEVDKKLNQVKIDAFIKRYGYLKKPLNAYTRLELPKLVSQLEIIEKKYEAAKINNAVDSLLKELNLSLEVNVKHPP